MYPIHREANPALFGRRFVGYPAARARSEKTSISDLVRQAVRERYLGSLTARKAAMQAVVGMWKDRPEIGDSKTTSAGSAAGSGFSD